MDDPDQFERIRLKVLQSDELVTLVPDLRDPDTGRRVTQLLYTSREMLGIERAMAQRAIRLAARRDHDVRPAFVARALAAEDQIIRDQSQGRFGLSEEQKEAVRYLTGDERIRAVIGLAGAGKSTLLAAARRAWEADRYTVHGAALAGKAAEELERSSGIKARTLASWELAWSQGRDRLGRDDVFVIDEAGMVPSRQLARVLAEVETRAAKIVLVGDAMQLQPIEAGAAFRAVTERVGYVELQGIRRQREAWAQAASLALARGQAGEALRAYDAHGAVRFRANGAEARAALIADWMAVRASGSSLILAHRNRDVWALNAGVREALQAAGALAAGEPFRTARGRSRLCGRGPHSVPAERPGAWGQERDDRDRGAGGPRPDRGPARRRPYGCGGGGRLQQRGPRLCGDDPQSAGHDGRPGVCSRLAEHGPTSGVCGAEPASRQRGPVCRARRAGRPCQL